ncbi:hypothetical protein [Kaarinaea lacus]
MFRKLTLIFMVLCAGCATQTLDYKKGIPVSEEYRSRIIPTDVHLVFEEIQLTEEPQVHDTSGAHTSAASSGNHAADILGHLLAELIIQNGSSSSVRRYEDPLLRFTKKYTIDDSYGKNVKEVLEHWSWFQVMNFELHRNSVEALAPNYNSGQSVSRSNANLVISTRYYFATDYRMLYVDTQAEWWPVNSKDEPKYRTLLRFVSPRIGNVDIEETLALWSENDGWRFQKTIALGLEENLRMMANVLKQVQYQPEMQRGRSLISYRGRAGTDVALGGKIQQNRPDMITVLTNTGDSFTIMNSDMTLSTYDEKLASVESSLVFSKQKPDEYNTANQDSNVINVSIE